LKVQITAAPTLTASLVKLANHGLSRVFGTHNKALLYTGQCEASGMERLLSLLCMPKLAHLNAHATAATAHTT